MFVDKFSTSTNMMGPQIALAGFGSELIDQDRAWYLASSNGLQSCG